MGGIAGQVDPRRGVHRYLLIEKAALVAHI
jgi:hypothetical protein